MKHSTAILYAMVILSLFFSVAAFALFAQSSGVFSPATPSVSPAPSETMTPYPTINYPQPTPQPDTHLSISYQESSRATSNGRATVTLIVTATYKSGTQTTLNYSQFYLQLYAPRQLLYVNKGTVNYPNHGELTLGPSNPTQTIRLTYTYAIEGSNGMDPAPVFYQLQCNSTATIDWPNQNYH